MAVRTRDEWIADVRAVLDLLESNPDLPLNLSTGVSVSYFPLGDVGDIEAMAAVDAVADMLGVAVTPPGPGSHYEAEIRFGSATYKAVAVLKDYRDRRRAIDRLGEAALIADELAAEGGTTSLDTATEAFVEAADAEGYALRDEYVNAAPDLVSAMNRHSSTHGTAAIYDPADPHDTALAEQACAEQRVDAERTWLVDEFDAALAAGKAMDAAEAMEALDAESGSGR